MSNLLPHQAIVEGRIGYPKLYTPERAQNDPTSTPRFGCQLYMPKDKTAAKKRLDEIIDDLVKERFKGVRPKSKDIFLKDGDGEYADKSGISAGCWIISANRAEKQGRPQVVDRAKKPIDSTESATIYAGCDVQILISVYVPKRGNTNQIAAVLEVVRKLGDNTPIGGGGVVDVENVLPDLPDDDESTDGFE